jgi:hypothetical protein
MTPVVIWNIIYGVILRSYEICNLPLPEYLASMSIERRVNDRSVSSERLKTTIL